MFVQTEIDNLSLKHNWVYYGWIGQSKSDRLNIEHSYEIEILFDMMNVEHLL